MRVGPKNKLIYRWARKGSRRLPSTINVDPINLFRYGAVRPERGAGAALPRCATTGPLIHLDEIATKVTPGALAVLVLDQAAMARRQRPPRLPRTSRSCRCRRVRQESSALGWPFMRANVRALLDHLDLGRADVMGYSMGARITAFFALAHPQRLRRAVFGGLGIHLVDGGLPESIAEALEAPSLADVHDPMGRMFRAFAEQTKSDLKALAACIRGSRQTLTREQVMSIRAPVLVAVGTKDTVSGSAHELAALLPAGRALDIPGRDHMIAVGDKVFKEGVLRFLAESP